MLSMLDWRFYATLILYHSHDLSSGMLSPQLIVCVHQIIWIQTMLQRAALNRAKIRFNLEKIQFRSQVEAIQPQSLTLYRFKKGV